MAFFYIYCFPLRPYFLKPNQLQNSSSGENKVKKWIGLLLFLTFSGSFSSLYGNNINSGAISAPNDIAIDASGNLYITDSYSNLYKNGP